MFHSDSERDNFYSLVMKLMSELIILYVVKKPYIFCFALLPLTKVVFPFCLKLALKRFLKEITTRELGRIFFYQRTGFSINIFTVLI